MENFVVGNYRNVYPADGEPLEIIGMGDVYLKISNGSKWKIQKVRHVPRLVKNIISIGQLDDNGHNVTFTANSWKINK